MIWCKERVRPSKAETEDGHQVRMRTSTDLILFRVLLCSEEEMQRRPPPYPSLLSFTVLHQDLCSSMLLQFYVRRQLDTQLFSFLGDHSTIWDALLYSDVTITILTVCTYWAQMVCCSGPKASHAQIRGGSLHHKLMKLSVSVSVRVIDNNQISLLPGNTQSVRQAHIKSQKPTGCVASSARSVPRKVLAVHIMPNGSLRIQRGSC